MSFDHIGVAMLTLFEMVSLEGYARFVRYLGKLRDGPFQDNQFMPIVRRSLGLFFSDACHV